MLCDAASLGMKPCAVCGVRGTRSHDRVMSIFYFVYLAALIAALPRVEANYNDGTVGRGIAGDDVRLLATASSNNNNAAAAPRPASGRRRLRSSC